MSNVQNNSGGHFLHKGHKKSYTAKKACALFHLSNLLEAKLGKGSIHCIKWRFAIYLWAGALMSQKCTIPTHLL